MRSAAQRARILRQRLLTGLAIVAGAWLGYGVLMGGDDTIEATAADDDRGYYLNTATLTEFGPDGAPRMVLRADSIEQRLSDRSVRLADLVIDYQTPEAGAWTVTAAEGRMPPDATALLLSGDVQVTSREARGGPAVIHTDQLSYDTKTSVIQTAEPVAVQFGAHRLEGRGLRVVLNEGTLRLESSVHGRFIP